MGILQMQSGIVRLEDLGIEPDGLDRTLLAMPPWVSASTSDL